jgi:hypothetical protein
MAVRVQWAGSCGQDNEAGRNQSVLQQLSASNSRLRSEVARTYMLGSSSVVDHKWRPEKKKKKGGALWWRLTKKGSKTVTSWKCYCNHSDPVHSQLECTHCRSWQRAACLLPDCRWPKLCTVSVWRLASVQQYGLALNSGSYCLVAWGGRVS